MTAGAPAPGGDRHWLPLIEALRAIAALSVAAHHVKDLGGIAPFTGSWILDGFGQWGVLLFFVLSGFLLCDTFWGTTSVRDLGAFYIRRMARIAPAYYVAVGLLFMFFAQHAQLFSGQGERQILANATFTHWWFPGYSSSLNVDGALWTLSIEVALYVTMPVLAWLIARAPITATTGLIAASVAWRAVVALDGGDLRDVWFPHGLGIPDELARLYVSRQFPGFLGVFALGIALRRLMVAGPPAVRERLNRPVGRAPVLVTVLLLVPSLVFMRETTRSSDFHHWLWFSAYDLVLSALLLIPLAYAARPVTPGRRPVLSVLTWLGHRSYSIYLWHFPVLLSVFGRGTGGHPPETDHRFGRIVLAAVLTLVASAISFAAIERPAQDWGRRKAKRLQRGPEPVPMAEKVPVAT